MTQSHARVRWNRATKRRVTSGIGLIAAASVTGVVLGVLPAFAVTTHSTCQFGDVCYWYQSYYGGSSEGVYENDPDFLSPVVYFQHAGTGQGSQLANDAGSAANYSQTCGAAIWYSANYTGAHIALGAYGTGTNQSPTLGSVNNNNRSQDMSYAAGC